MERVRVRMRGGGSGEMRLLGWGRGRDSRFDSSLMCNFELWWNGDCGRFV